MLDLGLLILPVPDAAVIEIHWGLSKDEDTPPDSRAYFTLIFLLFMTLKGVYVRGGL